MENSAIRKYQQRCSAEYSSSVGLPIEYRYPNGNLIRPVPPVKTATNGVMIIGAYPSARFESRLSPVTGRHRLVPIADNLQPFANEEYFDGIQVRKLESGIGLRKYLLDPLNLDPDKCWITDLVKVFLYKPEHADSCSDIFPEFKVPVLRPSFVEFGKRSIHWIIEECELSRPKIIITLGEEVSRIVSGSKISAEKLLVPVPSKPEKLNGCTTFYCPHPDACRRSAKWRERMLEIIQIVKELI